MDDEQSVMLVFNDGSTAFSTCPAFLTAEILREHYVGEITMDGDKELICVEVYPEDK